MARAKRGSAKKASPPASRSGRPHRGLFLLAALAVAGALAFVAARVPIGGRTVVERGRHEVELLTSRDVPRERRRSAPAHPHTIATRARPAERLSRSDRAALDRLIP